MEEQRLKLFPTNVSVFQFSIYGAVPVVCEEIKACHVRAGRPVLVEQSDPLFMPRSSLIRTRTLLTDDPAQESLLQKYQERVERLSQQNRVSKICSDEGFLTTVGSRTEIHNPSRSSSSHRCASSSELNQRMKMTMFFFFFATTWVHDGSATSFSRRRIDQCAVITPNTRFKKKDKNLGKTLRVTFVSRFHTMAHQRDTVVRLNCSWASSNAVFPGIRMKWLACPDHVKNQGVRAHGKEHTMEDATTEGHRKNHACAWDGDQEKHSQLRSSKRTS